MFLVSSIGNSTRVGAAVWFSHHDTVKTANYSAFWAWTICSCERDHRLVGWGMVNLYDKWYCQHFHQVWELYSFLFWSCSTFHAWSHNHDLFDQN